MNIPVDFAGESTSFNASVFSHTTILAGKLVTWSSTSRRQGQGSLQTQSFFVDPPMQSCGDWVWADSWGSTAPPVADPAPPSEPVTPGSEPPPGKDKTLGGFMEAAGTCATAGAGLGAAAGGVVGGVTGAIAGSAAGGIGAVPGAVAGAKSAGWAGGIGGAAVGSVVCGLMYISGWW